MALESYFPSLTIAFYLNPDGDSQKGKERKGKEHIVVFFSKYFISKKAGSALTMEAL